MLVGHARVPTGDQNPELQLSALRQAKYERVFVEKPSGAQRDRLELNSTVAPSAPIQGM